MFKAVYGAVICVIANLLECNIHAVFSTRPVKGGEWCRILWGWGYVPLLRIFGWE